MSRKGGKDATDSLRESVWGGGHRQVNRQDRDREKAEQTEMKNNDSKLGELFVIYRSLTETFRTSRGRVGREGAYVQPTRQARNKTHPPHVLQFSLPDPHRKNTSCSSRREPENRAQ